MRKRQLYHMGFRSPVRRSTLADANEQRDWQIYATFAQHLIAQAVKSRLRQARHPTRLIHRGLDFGLGSASF